MRETGHQLAEIWLSLEILERVDKERGGGMFLEDDLKKDRLDRSSEGQRYRWRAQVMGKTLSLRARKKGRIMRREKTCI